MNIRFWARSFVAVALAGVVACGGIPPDEAKARLDGSIRAPKEYPAEEASKGREEGSADMRWSYPPRNSDFDLTTPAGMAAAAQKYFPPARANYFRSMDAFGTTAQPGAVPPKLSESAIMGRNAWVLWAGGNEAFWDWLARHGYGSIDLLKLIDTKERGTRFAKRGLITEPGMKQEEPSAKETEEAFGIRYFRPDPSKHVEHTTPGARPPDPYVYGWPTGVVGLRLFPNPEFTGAAKKRWKADLYYSETPEGREYASRPDTIRPFRIGMSCGFCHVAPHPLNPPANPESPEWANLSNNIGNQYLRPRAVFGNTLRPDNFLYHVLDAQQPGTIDTSLIASDSNLNYNTIIPVYGMRGRVERAAVNPPEQLGVDTTEYFRDVVIPNYKDQMQSPSARPHIPRVLIDGSDSVGLPNALARVYLNIGTYHQQWVRVHNPLLGFRKQEPFRLKDISENSVYWHATQLRVAPLRDFFLESTDPMRLRDAVPPDPAKNQPGFPKEKLDQALGGGDGLPWGAKYADGRKAFAKGCIACHSSIQPGEMPELEKRIEVPGVPLADRTGIKLRMDDIARLTRGDGSLPVAYAQWAKAAVESPLFWEHKNDKGEVVPNFLSTEIRLPVSLIQTNSARAAATNARPGHLWEDVSSDTYRNLDAVGPIRYRDPFSAAFKSYAPLSGGPGYYRPPTLISAWASAPWFHNNMLGEFNNDPSLEGRLKAFDDAAQKLLYPERRLKPSSRVVWDDTRTPSLPKTVLDGGYRERLPPEGNEDPVSAADQLQADGGHIWRTTATSSLRFAAHDVPVLLAGITGFSPFWVWIAPWLPAIAFVVLGVILILAWRVVAWGERLDGRYPWIGYVFGPVRYVLAVGGLVAAGWAAYTVYRYWEVILVVDYATIGSIPLLRFLAFVLPVLFFGGISALFWMRRLSEPKRRRLGNVLGVACIVVGAVVAGTLGRFAAGCAGGIVFGPFPKGIPVGVVANLNPDAEPAKLRAALSALGRFALDADRPNQAAPTREAFETKVAPVLMDAITCPDFVTDRGHDFQFMRDLTDREKDALILLLKTF